MELSDPRSNAAPSADEWLVILAYRRCTLRRQAAIRYFAQALAGNDEENDDDTIIPFPGNKTDSGAQ